MGIQYDGKSPGKLWYGWQKTKALVKSFSEYSTEKDAKNGAKNAGFSIGSLFAGGAAMSWVVPLLPIPFIGTMVGMVACYASFNFGMKAYHKTKLVNKSPFVYNYVRQQEYKWMDRKSRKPLGQRIKAGIRAKLDKIPLGVVKAAKWAGMAIAAVGAIAATGGALNYAGIPAISANATTLAVVGGIAKAGALIGLTATAAVGTVIGLAVAAIPVGILLAVSSRKAVYRREADASSFKPSKQPKTAPVTQDNTPISKGVVFGAGQSFDFNDNAPPPAPPAASADNLSEERRKAAEARAAARKGKGNSNRFN